MWLDLLFQGCMDVIQSEQASKPVRVFCTVLISLVFLIGIVRLFLLTFVIEGQSFLRRVAFFVGAWYHWLLCEIFENGHER